jgi:hypothetical protein
MRSFRLLFDQIRARAGMYVQRPTYTAISSLVLGYDLACEGGVLLGFREWLIPRVGKGNQLAWPALVLMATFPEAENPDEVVQHSAAADKQAIDALFRLIIEFDEDRSMPDGMRKIFLAYERWLRDQEWYEPGSPGWIDSPHQPDRRS